MMCKRYYNRINELHNSFGPAREFPNGDKEWWVNGILHRLDGPALENANGSKIWCLLGRGLLKENFNNWIQRVKFLFT